MIKNIAVVGAGYWGKNLIRNMYELGVLNTICEENKELTAKMKKKYPKISFTVNFNDVLKDKAIEGIVISTPAHTHFALGKQALEAGKDVFVEKPFTTSIKDAQELIKLAEKKSKVLMTGFTFLYSGPVNKIKEIVDSGELGEIYYVHSQRLNLGIVRSDVNAWWNLAPHDVSILLHLFKTHAIEVNGKGFSFIQPDIEDVVNASIKFDNGKAAFIHVSWLDPNKVRKMMIVGSKKMLVYDDTSNDMKIQIFDKGIEKKNIKANKLPNFDSFAQFQIITRAGDIHIPKVSITEPLKEECLHFIDCIKNRNTIPKTGPFISLEVVKVMEAVQKSIKANGSRVTL